MFEDLMEYIEKTNAEELRAELESYGIEFVPNHAKLFKRFSCPSPFSFSIGEVVVRHQCGLLEFLAATESCGELPSYHVDIKPTDLPHWSRKDAA
jgi:hypothetical protein